MFIVPKHNLDDFDVTMAEMNSLVFKPSSRKNEEFNFIQEDLKRKHHEMSKEFFVENVERLQELKRIREKHALMNRLDEAQTKMEFAETELIKLVGPDHPDVQTFKDTKELISKKISQM